MTTSNIYLTFDGNCEEAFNFYKSVLGGEFHMLQRFKDMPPEYKVGKEDLNKLIHVTLPIGKDTFIMGSDTGEQFSRGFKQGNNFSISLVVDTREEADRIFNGLSKGGKVIMAMANTFWGAYFGQFADKFGVQWMVSFALPQEQKK